MKIYISPNIRSQNPLLIAGVLLVELLSCQILHTILFEIVQFLDLIIVQEQFW